DGMDRGSVLQVGAPNEVYDEPSSQFVAGFVSVSNLLELEVEAVEGGVARLRLGPRDEARTDAGTDLRPGQIATVTIRPERIAIADGQAAAWPGHWVAWGTS